MTPEQKLNKYYLKTFGWTLAEVDALFDMQGNVCAACGRPPGERRLSLDHDHAFDKVKIKVDKIPREVAEHPWPYLASAKDHNGDFYSGYGLTKKLARETVRILLRRQSVRSGLCMRCNRGLALFEDSKAPLPPSERLIRLARILENFKVRPTIEVVRSLSDKESHEKDHRNPSPAIPVDARTDV